MTHADSPFQRPRAFSAPAATLEYFVAAHTNPFSPRTSPSGVTMGTANPSSSSETPRSPSKFALGVVATSTFCESTSSLANPRDPRPFAATMFPSSIAHPSIETVTESSPSSSSSSLLTQLHPPLSLESAKLFLRTLPSATAPVSTTKAQLSATSPSSQRSGEDARTVVSNLALATVKELAKRPSERSDESPVVSPSKGEGDDAVPAEFYKSKYLEAVDQAAAEREDYRAKVTALEKERALWEAKETDYQTKLHFLEAQGRMQRESSERAVKSCGDLEEENKTLRRELLASSEQVEKFKEIASRCSRELKSSINLTKDLQGQLDLFRGNTSVSLLDNQPEVLVLRNQNQALEESNTKLLTRLGEATRTFAREKKQLLANFAELEAKAGQVPADGQE